MSLGTFGAVGVKSKKVMPDPKTMVIIEGYIEDICASEGVPPSIVKGVVWLESNFDITAYRYNYLNPADRSYGLMQLTLPTAQEIWGTSSKVAESNLYDPIFNIWLGTRYLKTQYSKYGSWEKAVAAYNAGAPRYTQAGMFINQSYVNIVFKAAQILKDSVIAFSKLIK